MTPADHSTSRWVRAPRWLRDDSGFGPVETSIVIGIFILMIPLMIAFGRVAKASGSVDTAAFMAARSASLARTAGEAQEAASSAAAEQLSRDGVACSSRDVAVDTSGFATAPGTTAFVRVTVTCRASLGDLPVPGLSPSKSVSGSYTSVIDTFRGRS